MKKNILLVLGVMSIAAISLIAHAQEQKEGQPLYLPQEQVSDRPSDLHMGSDPGYKPGTKPAIGSDETGYPTSIDPQQQIEEKTTYKNIDEPQQGQKPPSRWEK